MRLGAELDGTGGSANARPERRWRRNKQAARETTCGLKAHAKNCSTQSHGEAGCRGRENDQASREADGRASERPERRSC
jgi:hypothetical protein